MTDENNFEGLKGWLILVGLGIVITPFLIIIELFPFYSEMFSNGTWTALTVPGTKAFNPLWKPILLGEMAINSGMVFTWSYIAFLFFMKKKEFPLWYIGILLFTLLFLVIDPLTIKSILPDKDVYTSDTTDEIIRALVVALIWIPYIRISKRVKATFVK